MLPKVTSTGIVSSGTTIVGQETNLVDGSEEEELLDSMEDSYAWIEVEVTQLCFGMGLSSTGVDSST